MRHDNLENNSEGLLLLGQRVRPAPQPRRRRAPITAALQTQNQNRQHQQFDFIVPVNASKSTAESRHDKCIKCNNQISVQPLRPSYQLKINTIGDVFNDDDNDNDGGGDESGVLVTWGEGSRALGHHLMNIREAETVQQLQGLLRTHKRIQHTYSNTNQKHNRNNINNNNNNNKNNKRKSKEEKDLDYINIINSSDIDATLAASIGNEYERCFLVHHTVLQDVIAQAKHSAGGGIPSGVTPHEAERKLLRETLYAGIFDRHRRTIFALGSFLRMLRTRRSNYNTIQHDAEDTD